MGCKHGYGKGQLLLMRLVHFRFFYICVLAANVLNVVWFKTKPITENQALHAVSCDLPSSQAREC